MCSSRFIFVVFTMVAMPAAANDFMVGAGIEADSDSGIAETAIADYGVSDKTWLSAAVAHSGIDLPLRDDLDAWFVDVGVDHYFEPFGVQAGIAYWGDSDTLSSNDARASVYWRSDRVRLALNGETRDFDFEVLGTDFAPARQFTFDANGIGLSARFELSDSADLYLSGMDYDYSVNLRIVDDRLPLLDLLSVSRLSLINSLIDHRASVGLGVDFGQSRVSFDVSQSRGAVDGSDTTSTTVRLLMPLGRQSDIEFGLGLDDSELYGEVTFFSIFLYFYGT